jgi:hypothetical protein
MGSEDMNAKPAFIAARVAGHAIRLMSRVPAVSPGWFHAWQGTAPARAERPSPCDALLNDIRAILKDSKWRYGAPRIRVDSVCRYAVTFGTFSLASQIWEEGDVHDQRSTRD